MIFAFFEPSYVPTWFFFWIFEINSHRSAVEKLRYCNFNLGTRTGAWTDTPRDNRVCRFCEKEEIADEIHVLIMCHHFDDVRQILFQQLLDAITYKSATTGD